MERKLENDYWLQRPDSNRRPQGYEPRELPLLHSAVCPLRGIPLCQQARKAYASSRTMGRTAGNEPTRRPTGQLGVMLCAYCPDSPPGTGVDSVNSLLRGHLTISPPASCSVWDMSPPRCCRTGKNGGCEEEDRGPLFHPASSRYLFYTVSRFALGKYLWQV